VAVEVFRSSALIHRVGELGSGEQGDPLSFELRGLPLELVDSSVRVSVEAASGDGSECTVLDLHVALNVESPTEEVALEEVERFKGLRRKLDGMQRKRELLEQEADELLKMIPELPPPPKRPDQDRFSSDNPLPAWLRMVTFFQERAATLQGQAREMQRRMREVGDQVKQARDQLDRLSSDKLSKLRISKKVRLRLARRVESPRRVRLSYQVPGARWFPSYELRVDGEDARAELVMTALVAQVTGEDWSGVSLSLSTADLHRRSDLPTLGAWRIGRARPAERQRAWRELPEDLPQLFSDYDRDLPPEPGPPGRELAVLTGKRDQRESLEGMIAETLADIGPRKPRPQPPPPPEPEADEDDFSPAEITRENLEEAIALEEAFEDEPTPPEETQLFEAAAVSHRAAAKEMPPPASMPAPAPEAARMKQSKRRSTGVSAASPKQEYSAGGAPAFGRGETSLVPADELLAFDGLVLATGREQGRGMLRPMQQQEMLTPDQRGPEVLEAISRTRRRTKRRLQEIRVLPLPGGVREVTESTGHFAYRYQTAAPVDLPGDGALHRVGILRQQVGMEQVYRVVPQADTSVFRLAKVKNPLSQPLLAGPMDVFWGNDFLVTATLETTAPGATIEAGLGVEPRVKVVRNVRHSQHEEGLISSSTVYEDQIRIEVQSALRRPALIEVIERVPVTEERKVEVKPLQEKPAAEEYDQSDREQPIRGGRRWKLRLEPGERAECQLSYSVTLPASSEIVGGGRRA
jgi:hypothetical protein